MGRRPAHGNQLHSSSGQARQEALEARQAGIQVAVVPQACGSRRPDDKALALQRLAQAGITLVAPEMVAFEWMRGCEHPAFREVLGLIKSAPA